MPDQGQENLRGYIPRLYQISVKKIKPLLPKILKFFLTLIVLAIPFYLLLNLEPYFLFLQDVAAINVQTFLELIGLEVSRESYLVFLMGKGLEVAPACIGWRSIAVFLAIVIATPLKKKNYWLALGLTPILYGFNIFRLSTSLITFVLAPGLFDAVHGFLWKYGMTLLVLGLWWYWFKLSS